MQLVRYNRLFVINVFVIDESYWYNVHGFSRLTTFTDGSNTIKFSLLIYQLGSSDYGKYKCVATNNFGLDEGIVDLKGRLR